MHSGISQVNHQAVSFGAGSKQEKKTRIFAHSFGDTAKFTLRNAAIGAGVGAVINHLANQGAQSKSPIAKTAAGFAAIAVVAGLALDTATTVLSKIFKRNK